MPNTKFDSKSFNAEAFKYLVDRVPNLKTNEMRKMSLGYPWLVFLWKGSILSLGSVSQK